MSMISGSTSALSFIQIAAGRPFLACAISSRMCSHIGYRALSGETAMFFSSAGTSLADMELNTTATPRLIIKKAVDHHHAGTEQWVYGGEMPVTHFYVD